MHVLDVQFLDMYCLLHNHSLLTSSNVIGDCLWKQQLNGCGNSPRLYLLSFGSDPKMD